jgi:hypothetical protein
MDLKNACGLKQLMASCPTCQRLSFYYGKIPSKKKDLNGKEVLFCTSCKFVLPVEEYKKMLFCE